MPTLLKEIFVTLLTKGAAHLGGFQAWIIKTLLRWGGQALLDLFADLWSKLQRWAKQEKAQKELEDVLKNPEATVDDRGKAYEDFINAGRK